MFNNEKELINIINNDIITLELIFKYENIFDSSINKKYEILLSNHILSILLPKIKNNYSYYFLCIISLYSDNLETFIFITNKYNITYDDYILSIKLIINNITLNHFIDYIDEKIKLNDNDKCDIYINACKCDNIYIINKYFTKKLFNYNNYLGIKLIQKKETFMFFSNKININEKLLIKLFEYYCINLNYECVNIIYNNNNFNIKNINIKKLKNKMENIPIDDNDNINNYTNILNLIF